ncbi:Ff.00g026080.m01.CDS01 [Fusarium sp. VM40]|nr:Ff.00g026080.m01.CDS01 [Fusarium sp. VM40]
MEGIIDTKAVIDMDMSDPDPSENPEKPPISKKPEPVTEGKKTRPTLKVRDNLLYWKCNQALHDGSTCGSFNEVGFKQCKDCKARRGVGDDGTDAYGTKIAKLVHVNNTNGDEFWQYTSDE